LNFSCDPDDDEELEKKLGWNFFAFILIRCIKALVLQWIDRLLLETVVASVTV
jgi:hypothetical protein